VQLRQPQEFGSEQIKMVFFLLGLQGVSSSGKERGDWANYLSPSMAENYLKIVEEKLSGIKCKPMGCVFLNPVLFCPLSNFFKLKNEFDAQKKKKKKIISVVVILAL
jgi:hypothetical protein